MMENKKQGGYNYSLNSSASYQISPSAFSRIGLNAGQQGSKIIFYKYDYWGANAMAAYALKDMAQLSAQVSYTDSTYAGKEAAYSNIRHDQNTTVGIDVTYHIKPITADFVLAGVRRQLLCLVGDN